MDKINPKGINLKDLRTYKATVLAKQLLQDKSLGIPPPLPANSKDIKKLVQDKLKLVFSKVAELLNNSPTMAKNSYVHPVVITDFLTNLGITAKLVGYKHVTLESKKIMKEEEIKEAKFTSMDEMFEKNVDYGADIDTKGISEEDSDECEEYELPEWFENDNYDLIKK